MTVKEDTSCTPTLIYPVAFFLTRSQHRVGRREAAGIARREASTRGEITRSVSTLEMLAWRGRALMIEQAQDESSPFGAIGSHRSIVCKTNHKSLAFGRGWECVV